MIHPAAIAEAHARIAPYIVRTPLLESEALNAQLGGRVLFKFEGFQKTGAFKLRGALNALLSLKEQGALPERVVAYSSGNHAQAVAYAAKLLSVRATIYIPGFSSPYKIAATRAHGAEVVVTETRDAAEQACQREVENGAVLIPPFDSDLIIAGQGTSCFEALQDGPSPDVIFATIGGGGWISGTWLAAQLLSPRSMVIGAEPAAVNDAARSFRSGEIHRFASMPETIADGARTPSIAPRTFAYIRQLQDVMEIDEATIIDWTRQLAMQLKITAEPTSAVAAAACARWFADTANRGKTALVMLSGGNIDPATQARIWSAG